MKVNCSNCGNKARYKCLNCNVALCGRCRSRRKKSFFDNAMLPAGLCRNCSQLRPLELTLKFVDKIVSSLKK